MKKIIALALSLNLIFVYFLAVTKVNAQTASIAAQDEAAGSIVWNKLQSKQVACSNLTDNDFDVLGDYFIGQRLGSTSLLESMNNRMTSMMGSQGETTMHISLGNRLSGCNTVYAVPASASSFLSELGLSNMMGGTSMMGFYNVYPLISLIFCLLVSTFLVLGIIYFWKGISKKK